MSELKPGRELDALVAEKVMGWAPFAPQVLDKLGFHFCSPCDICGREGEPFEHCLPYFSTKIEAAWKVVEKVIELPQFNDRHCYFNIQQHRAEFKEAEVEMRLFELRDGEELLCGPYYVLGESAPHAICLAALKAVGYDPNK